MRYALRKNSKGPYSGRVQELRSKLRRCLKAALGKHPPMRRACGDFEAESHAVKLTGDKHASMWWTLHRYHQYLYVRRHVCIVGWPTHVRFTNLSYLNMGVIMHLQNLFSTEKLTFEYVDDDTYYENTRRPEAVAFSEEYDLGRPFAGRDDIKKSRFDSKTGEPISRRAKVRTRGAITPKYVVDTDGEKEYPVERILDCRPRGRGYQYLVRWLGYGPEHDSWLPGREVAKLAALDAFLRERGEL
ncbi:hypothetical protein TRAPUB_13488 [Trametes pubescens]|uniref:Chromo domain-containing protein n=1 Tax=Trametes pubescens TaxID=154538 RepID=A0A1M2VR43_TRAPU|nr:hypothetical protein TRAPUB_13488 [Trametes pubescens]